MATTRTSRRHFLSAIPEEVVSLLREVKGTSQHRLDDLGSLPDETLAELVPRADPECQVLVDEDHVSLRDPADGALLARFANHDLNVRAFNQLNGVRTIAQIVDLLAEDLGCDRELAFEHVKHLFLGLAARGVCSPCNEP